MGRNGKQNKENVIFYVYKIHFLCGFPTGRYYIGRHKHNGDISKDRYTGSGDFCKAYFKKYGKVQGETYIKEILEINPTDKINRIREKFLIGDLYKTDPLCMNMIAGGDNVTFNDEYDSAKPVLQYDYEGNLIAEYKSQSEAASAIGLATSSGISKCCSEKKGQCGGFI